MEKEEKKIVYSSELIILVIVIFLIVAWPAVLVYFKTIGSSIGISSLDGYESSFISAVKSIVGFLIGLSFPLSLFFFIGIIYCVERLKQLRHKESLVHDAKVEPAYETVVAGGNKTLAAMWGRVTTHINSANQNDWKQAIVEADMILDDLLTHMGYRGESVGEKLKRVESSDMNTLQDAWEAHKVRNRIAHEPGFTLNQIEARQTIHSYKKVFEEFYYI